MTAHGSRKHGNQESLELDPSYHIPPRQVFGDGMRRRSRDVNQGDLLVGLSGTLDLDGAHVGDPREGVQGEKLIFCGKGK